MGWKIYLPQDILPEGREYLESHGHTLVIGTGTDEETLCREIKGMDAMVCRTTKITRKVFEAADQLKVVARHGAGFDFIDVVAAKDHGVMCVFAPTANSDSVAETAVMNMLIISRNFKAVQKEFLNDYMKAKMKIEKHTLHGKTLGIIGCGRIGTLVAEKCNKAFSMKVLAWDPFRPVDSYPDFITPIKDLDELLGKSDFVSVHSPLTADTKEFINKEKFQYMKRTAYLINTSRGMVVNEKDLYDACKEGVIAGAALDVLQEEPISPDNPILSLDNVIVSPHIGGATKEASINASLMCARGIEEVYEGKKPTYPVPGF